MKANYHTHTPRCQHASGTEAEYVLAAIEAGFDTLGFADHTAWNYGEYVSGMRMREDQLPDYVSKVRAAGQEYADKIRVLCGLECEYFPENLPWLRETREKFSLDYVILGNHFSAPENSRDCMYYGNCRTREDIYRYMKSILDGMATGEYLYLAHPDLYLSQYPAFDEDAKKVAQEICRTAKEQDFVLEYNLMGLLGMLTSDRFKGLGYPCRKFWEVAAQEGCRCIIGVDAHAPVQLSDPKLYTMARNTLAELGFTPVDSMI